MKDAREPVHGRLHLIEDTGELPNSTTVLASTDQGQPNAWGSRTSKQQCENYMIRYLRDQENYLSDQAAQEALKAFILELVPEYKLTRLKKKCLVYTNVTLKQFMDLLCDDFPASPEERTNIKLALQEKWNPAEDIAIMFNRNKELLESLADMQGNNTYTDEDLIEYTYMDIKNTGEFNTDCEKWKQLPEDECNTEELCREYFLKRYNEFDSKQGSLHNIGVANTVVQELEGGLQVAQNQVAELQLQLKEQQNELNCLKMVQTQPIAATASTGDETSTMSQLTAMTAELAKLQTQYQQLLLAQQPGCKPVENIDVRKSSNRGRRKYFKNNDNACWSCGYDILKRHNSSNCNNKRKGHIDWHTGATPAPGHNSKYMERSKWKDSIANKSTAGKLEDFS